MSIEIDLPISAWLTTLLTGMNTPSSETAHKFIKNIFFGEKKENFIYKVDLGYKITSMQEAILIRSNVTVNKVNTVPKRLQIGGPF